MVEYDVVPVGSFAAELGEGPCWDSRGKCLYYVDILGKKLLKYEAQSGDTVAYDMPSYIGTVAPTEGSELVVALQDGAYLFNPESQKLELLCELEKENDNNRTNDGKCDPRGRFWVGTMPLSERSASGSLYSISGKNAPVKHRSDVTISNGIAFDEDKHIMYYIDTPLCCVEAYDYNADTGSISNPRKVVEVDGSVGHPDGMTIDSEGMLWVALWGGCCVNRYNPATGELLAHINVPAKNVTACTFAGDNLNTMYITAAQHSKDERVHTLFKVELPHHGIDTYRFAL